MRVAVACLVVLALAGCSGDGDGDDAGPDDAADDSGCLVEPDRVGEQLGYEVVVEEGPKGEHECRFEPADPDAHPGAEVTVAARELADDDDAYAAALAAVEAEAGPTTPLTSGDVDHANRGWVARVGRAVQVGAVRDRRLVQVTVVDATLDAAAAEDVAFDLAGRALG